MFRFTRNAVKTAAALFAASLAVVGISGTADAATGVDGFQILHGSSNQTAHKCKEIGAAVDPKIKAQVHGIVCANLYTYDNHGQTYVNSSVEAYCQVNYAGGRTKTVQCANIVSKVEYADGVGTRYIYSKTCGHEHGACPTGRYLVGETFQQVNSLGGSCGTNPRSKSQVWGLALAGTQIELPGSDAFVTLSSNLSTGHYYVCY